MRKCLHENITDSVHWKRVNVANLNLVKMNSSERKFSMLGSRNLSMYTSDRQYYLVGNYYSFSQWDISSTTRFHDFSREIKFKASCKRIYLFANSRDCKAFAFITYVKSMDFCECIEKCNFLCVTEDLCLFSKPCKISGCIEIVNYLGSFFKKKP